MSGPPQEVVDVDDSDDLYRRIAPDHVNPDGTINSGAYKYGGEFASSISLDLARLTTRQDALRPRPTFGLGSLRVAVPRSLGLTVRHAPGSDNRAHCLIEGQTTKAICRQLAESTTLIVAPDPSRVIP